MKNGHMKSQSNHQLFKRALGMIRAGDLIAASEVFKKIIKTEPKAYDVRANLGYIHFKTGNYKEAYSIFRAMIEEFPKNVDSLNRLGLAAMYLGKLDEAESALQEAAGLEPNHFDTWINLCALAGFQSDEAGSLRYAARALEIKPNNPGAFVNLGSALQFCNKLSDARIAFETAIELNPKELGAILNLGVISAQAGDEITALNLFDSVILKGRGKVDNRTQEARFYKSLSLLRLGRLAEAWPLYDAGFARSLTHGRGPYRSFPRPRWDGSKLEPDQTLLVWKEQGIGDELLFLSVLPELNLAIENIIVECDARLVSPLSRSFPTIRFREAIYLDDEQHSAVHDDYDFEIPMGSLFGLFRPSIETFSNSKPIVQSDTSECLPLRRRIALSNSRLKVGICWRSGQLSALRNLNYTSISDWGPIFRCRQDITFFSLQYGNPEEEIRSANNSFKVHINSWPDIDYKNDFEALFTLCSEMDLVITVGTAVSTIAASVGTPTWLMSPASWTSFGTDHFLAYPSVQLFRPARGEPVSSKVAEVVNALVSFCPKKGALLS